MFKRSLGQLRGEKLWDGVESGSSRETFQDTGMSERRALAREARDLPLEAGVEASDTYRLAENGDLVRAALTAPAPLWLSLT